MSETYGPFNAGSGAAFDETMWRELLGNLFTPGVIKGAKVSGSAGGDLAVTTAGSGLGLHLASGVATNYGFFYENSAQLTKTLTTADGTLNRIDRLVIELDFAARTVLSLVLVGTLASSPSAPTLTQSSTKWDIPLAQISVAHGVTLITSGMITDERTFSGVNVANLPVGATVNGNIIFTTATDGPGSGNDADTLDGINSLGFLQIGSNGKKIYVGPSTPGDVTKWSIWLKTPFS